MPRGLKRDSLSAGEKRAALVAEKGLEIRPSSGPSAARGDPIPSERTCSEGLRAATVEMTLARWEKRPLSRKRQETRECGRVAGAVGETVSGRPQGASR